MTEVEPRIKEPRYADWETPPPRFDGCPMTEDELMRLPDDGCKYELVNGRAKYVSTGMPHGRIATRVIRLLGPYADPVGELYDADTGFRMIGGNIRSPDVSFVRSSRFPGGEEPSGYGPFAPDLCVEVVSRTEDMEDAMDKVREYFASGAEQVWHLFPDTQTVKVFLSPIETRHYAPDDEIEAATLLPGFRAKASGLFGRS